MNTWFVCRMCDIEHHLKMNCVKMLWRHITAHIYTIVILIIDAVHFLAYIKKKTFAFQSQIFLYTIKTNHFVYGYFFVFAFLAYDRGHTKCDTYEHVRTTPTTWTLNRIKYSMSAFIIVYASFILLTHDWREKRLPPPTKSLNNIDEIYRIEWKRKMLNHFRSKWNDECIVYIICKYVIKFVHS